MRLLPVTEEAEARCEELRAQFRKAGLRVEVAARERLAKLIRTAETDKIPLMAIVGANEIASGGVTLRTRARGDLGAFPAADVLASVLRAVATRAADVDLPATKAAAAAPAAAA